MLYGLGSILSGLMTYPVMICSIIVAIVSIILLITKRKTMKKALRIVLLILVVIAVAIIAFLIIMMFAFGSNQPVTLPVPSGSHSDMAVGDTVNNGETAIVRGSDDDTEPAASISGALPHITVLDGNTSIGSPLFLKAGSQYFYVKVVNTGNSTISVTIGNDEYTQSANFYQIPTGTYYIWSTKEWPASSTSVGFSSNSGMSGNAYAYLCSTLPDGFVSKEKQIAKVISAQIREVAADMKYNEIIALLGETADIGFGRLILRYEVDGDRFLDIAFTSLDTPCGYSGDELLATLTYESSIYALTENGRLTVLAEGVSNYRLKTNSEKISVSVSGIIGDNASIYLYNANGNNEIAVMRISSDKKKGEFTNLTSATDYFLIATGIDGCGIILSD